MKQILLLGLLGMVLSLPAQASEPSQWRVEGIVYEKDQPEKSVAIINGNLLREGEKYEGYRVIKIESESVTLQDTTSDDVQVLHPKASPPPPQKSNQKPEGYEAYKASLDETSSQNIFQTMLQSVRSALEGPVLVNLKSIHTAATIYAIDAPRTPVTLEALAENSMIEAHFADGVEGDYQYRIRKARNGVEAFAEPVKPKPGSTSYYIDPSGNLHKKKL